MNHCMTFILQQLRRKIDRRCKVNRITDHTDEIFNHIASSLLRHTRHSTIIQYPHKQITAKSVQERANALVYIVFNSISTTLKFHSNRLSN